ncbi:hypothetical protein HaLaN_12657 [Haematococcus lacustris]|uniref:Uncharacterized protein n=1 Tax=Haematococcus lacustris TaxID=44745 RepID=A0A699Z2I9_HAELA|nr:hypothetical protein HaLaN_12657 [Haematococcus lacustris]
MAQLCKIASVDDSRYPYLMVTPAIGPANPCQACASHHALAEAIAPCPRSPPATRSKLEIARTSSDPPTRAGWRGAPWHP